MKQINGTETGGEVKFRKCHSEIRIQYVYRHHNIILDLFTFLINLTGLIVHDASMQMYKSYITLSTSEITFSADVPEVTQPGKIILFHKLLICLTCFYQKFYTSFKH